MVMGKWAEQSAYSVNSCRCFSKQVRDHVDAGDAGSDDESVVCAASFADYCELSRAGSALTAYTAIRTEYYRYGWGYENAGYSYAD